MSRAVGIRHALSISQGVCAHTKRLGNRLVPSLASFLYVESFSEVL